MGDQKIIEIKELNAAFGGIRTYNLKCHYGPLKLFHTYFRKIYKCRLMYNSGLEVRMILNIDGIISNLLEFNLISITT